ncbi:TonB-linked SusC/RagA family outer membrane protein [Parabacteroides sp. PFB2-12]|uniref:SusC/RagA family TonB-linked outer membrane protein n=1 Tax=unclassified Parabacteroides TaxID=2649774 RepID=UPI00247551D3|nr:MULTISPECIES: TonB-dependent receptor [unclassified Parabacteroides]MDH6343621.1 TonB-linked SusC/RagA family outer membrane protein [Parabacteroides sp. PM6-13]MDH6391398.1 TonB-linked SusC/RagA family outer membrane protein [Parabacteroides sp. PFB2-12]
MKHFHYWILAILFSLPIPGFAQDIQVRGQVTDVSGESVIGVNVRIKDKTTGTITDFDGYYNVEAASNDVLIFSYIGYITQEVAINGKTTLNIRLLEDTQTLDEVVVIGYGSMKKSDLTGAVVSANLKDFEKSPNTNVIQSLQGTVPGLNIGQTTTAGSTPSISIRGKNTLSGNTSVLIVLDGIIYTSSLSSINPNDIESIDILKDASATAVYGAQAANGVLLITTKKGKEGKAKVSFSSAYSISNPTKNLRPMNREEYFDYTKKLWYDKAYMGPDYTTPNPDFKMADYLPDIVMLDNSQSDGISPYDYNWWDEGTRTGSIFENRLSVSGGNKDVSYLISFENVTQEGYILNDDFKRNSIRINLDAQPYTWAKLGVQAFGSFVNQDGAEPGVWALITQNPLIEPYDEKGNIVPYPFQTLDTNPFMGSDVSDRERHNYFFANTYAEITLPIKGLTYRVNFGNNYRIDESFRANEYGASLTGQAYKRHTSYHDYTIDNILNYNNTFGRHSIAATLLYGASERKYSYTNADSQKFERLTLGYNALELGKDQYTYSDAWKEALLYQMARVNYKFNDRYLMTATVRRDGFSGFAENNKTAVFPSVALAWLLSEEDFFRVSWVDYLKIRGGWGISGNLTSRYKSQAKVTTASGYVFGDGGATEIRQQINSMANKDLKWEKTAGFNMGVDFNLFKNRLNGTIEAYQTETKDLLYDMAIPTLTGFSQVSSNIGKIRNRGIELTLSSRNIVTKDFEWETTFNISSNQNKILSLLGQDMDGDGKEDDLIASNLFIGQSTSAIYNYIIDGIWQLSDDIPKGYHAGNYKIRDTTGEGDVTVDDRVIVGKGDPAYRLGLMNKFRYKDFSLSFFINSVQGGSDGYLQSNSSAITRGNANDRRWNRISEMAAAYWSPNNPNATYSLATTSGTLVPTLYQDRSFIRLQDVNISYNFPKKWINRIGVEHLDLFLNGKNLITITDWKGWDPEAGSDYFGRPVLRSFTFGLNITL